MKKRNAASSFVEKLKEEWQNGHTIYTCIICYKMRNILYANQIKAARALLNWSQEDLARTAGLSVATIRKIESGSISPRDHTLTTIVQSFQNEDIEFLGSSGVRLRKDDPVVYEGAGCFLEFIKDVYHTLYKKNGELLMLNCDSHRADDDEMRVIGDMRRHGIKMRFLYEEGDTFLHYTTEEIRWVPSKYFRSNLQLVYHDYVATCLFEDETLKMVSKIIVLKDAMYAAAMKNSFEFMWDHCRQPPFSTYAPKDS